MSGAQRSPAGNVDLEASLENVEAKGLDETIHVCVENKKENMAKKELRKAQVQGLGEAR